MRAYGRPEPYIGARDKLHPDVEYELAKLLKLEVEGLKDLLEERKKVKGKQDYSRYDSFRAIDKYKVNSLLREDIRMFLDRNGMYATALDVENLMKRVDMDQDGRVTYTEFCDFMEAGEQPASQNNMVASDYQAK